MNKESTQEKDQYPLYCLSFSPNWNTYQIISTNNKGLLVYGSNAESFLIDFQNKNFITSFKSQEEASSNQLKVTSVLLNEETLFVGYSNGTVSAFSHIDNNQVLFKVKASQNQIMHLIQRFNATESLRLLIIDSEGAVFELVSLQGVVKIFPLAIKCASQVVRCGEYLDPNTKKSFLLLISQKGFIGVWDLEKQSEIFSYNTNSSISKADFMFEDENTLTCGLITKKSFLLIAKLNLTTIISQNQESQALYTFPVKLNFQLQSKVKGDPEVLASKPDILFIGTNKVLISGKTGELFLLPLKTLQQKQELELKHLSAISEEEPLYQIVERNPHYKQISGMGKYNQKDTTVFYTLGNDRKLSFWKYEEDELGGEITPQWYLNFLGGKVKKIVTSELEKNKIVFTCIDKTIRVWDLEKKNNKFSTQEIWKQVSQTQIYQITMHPSCEGICAYSTEDNKICMFDLSAQVCFKVLKLETGIRSLQWIHKDYYNHIVNFANGIDNKTLIETNAEKEEGEDAKVNIKYGFLKTNDPNFTKKLSEDYFLLAILQDNHIMLLGIAEKIEFYNTRLLVKQDSFNYIPINHNENQINLIIATGSKDGETTFWETSSTELKRLGSFKFNNYHISSIKFNKGKDQTILCATSSHDRKIVIYEVSFLPKNDTLNTEITPRMLFKHKNKVDDLKWSNSNKLLAISLQDKTVQIWDCILTEVEKKVLLPSLPEATPNREVCNIRGHEGFITDATFSLNDDKIVITASDDQTIKVWNIDQIAYKSLANPKKKNKKKKHKPASLDGEEPPIKKQVKPEKQQSQITEEKKDEEIEEEVSS